MRADSFFAEKYGSRTRAKEALLKGLVLRAGKPLSPSDDVKEGDEVQFLEAAETYVSRGGFKLARGLDTFGESVEDCVFADLGASTGGFCDVLLRRGIKRVYAVDVGESQLDMRIADDRRVTVMDGVNARYLKKEDFPEQLDGVVSDLSFISLKLVLPAVAQLLSEGGRAFVLFKPQFECGGAGLGKSGILPVKYHKPLLADFYAFCCGLGLAPQGVVNAPLHERKNIEYVVFLKKGAHPASINEFLACAARLI